MRIPQLLSLALLLTACAAAPPRWEAGLEGSEAAAQALLARSVAAVQGPQPLREVRADYEGSWGFWITRIQPEITDPQYRHSQADVLRPAEGLIEQVHTGPAGQKFVRWDGEQVQVSYSGGEQPTPEQAQASALVAEAYQLFLLGPRYLASQDPDLRLLEDRCHEGQTYRRLIARLEPGLGQSPADLVELWIDPATDLPYRVHFTLEGFPTTRGAHADTTYLAWTRVQGHAFPIASVERVRGPIRLHAHSWRAVNLELDL